MSLSLPSTAFQGRVVQLCPRSQAVAQQGWCQCVVFSGTLLGSVYSHASSMEKAGAEIHTSSTEHILSVSLGRSIIYQFLSRGRIGKPKDAV